jgi:hypothetical protein
VLAASFQTLAMKFSFLIIILLIIGCNSNSKNFQTVKEVPKNDTTIATNNFVDFDSMDARRQLLSDSTNTFLNKLLDSSLRLAYRHGFDIPFTLTLDTSVFRFKNMYATISFGHLFSSDRQHLIIKRFINEYGDYETSLYSDIFLLDKNKFIKVATDTSDNGYGEDYLEDVNHDGYKDYVVQSYSGAGCCPRNLEMGYVYNSQNGHFKTIDFFNRETDTLSNNFFETSYGRDNYINLYKYKWRGLKKVLLEEIYVTPTKEGAMNPHPTSYTLVSYPSEKKQKIKKLPKEFARLKMAEYISPLEN